MEKTRWEALVASGEAAVMLLEIGNRLLAGRRMRFTFTGRSVIGAEKVPEEILQILKGI